MRTKSWSDSQELAILTNLMPGRGPDDLSSVTEVRVAGNGAADRVNGGPGDGYQHGRGNSGGFLASNGGGNNSSNPHHQDSSPRLLQRMHSIGDLDALRPRKTPLTGPFFD